MYTDREKLDDQLLEVLSCMGRVWFAHWSRTQVSVALSSAEAELNASVKAACEAIGMKQPCGHLGMPVIIKMFGDSSAMTGTLSRKGSGKVKTLGDTTALASGARSFGKRGFFSKFIET